MRYDCRRQFVDGNGDQVHPGPEFCRKKPGFPGSIALHDGEMCIRAFWALLFNDFQQACQGAPLGTLLFERLNLSVLDAQDRLDLQHFTQQGFSSTDATAFLQIFQGIHQEKDMPTGDPFVQAADNRIYVGTFLRPGVSQQNKAGQVASNASASIASK